MIKKIYRLFLKLLFWFFGLSILSVLIFRFIPVPLTPLMVQRCIEHVWEGKPVELKHDWVPYEEISPSLVRAVIASEDQRFPDHFGFDMEAIKKAMEYNKKGKKIRGGSTISQQTAKNVFLLPSRSFVRKGFEAYFTLLIEVCWSKERIIEVYLNSIEMGPGIYGAQAASLHWFKKDASKLTAYEAAAIAAILPNPLKYKAQPATPYIERRKNTIVRQMRYLGVIKL